MWGVRGRECGEGGVKGRMQEEKVWKMEKGAARGTKDKQSENNYV